MEHKNFQHVESEQSSKGEKIVPPSTVQWAILFSLSVLPDVLGIVSMLLGANLHVHLVVLRLARLAVAIVAFLFVYRVGGGGYARMAARRMWTSTGTPVVLIALVPLLMSVSMAMIQLHGIDHLELVRNLLTYEYKGKTHPYIPRFWIEDWFAPTWSLILDGWVTILILSNSRRATRDHLLLAFYGLLWVFGVTYVLVSHKFYPHSGPVYALRPSTQAWWIAAISSSLVCNWVIFRSLERGFRPSLLPITVFLTASAVNFGMFERPTDAYGVASHLLGAGIIWLVLRKSKWGIEKWSEYQQGQETLQT